MSLSDVHFTAQDVRDFFNELDINAIIKNISKMPRDDQQCDRCLDNPGNYSQAAKYATHIEGGVSGVQD